MHINHEVKKSSTTKLTHSFYGRTIFLCVAYTGLAQAEEVLSDSVRDVLQQSVQNQAEAEPGFDLPYDANAWLNEMSRRLQKQMPDTEYRTNFLKSLHYEATRAGLDPGLVLALIEVKSSFNKNAVSTAGARGYMQVMPFWAKAIGNSDTNLFNMRVNFRFGCTILRHYLDIEKGDLYRALGRYDGSLGRSEFPDNVRTAWHEHWKITSP